jgi:putative phosphonoacetaldehyde dehydrogenase
MLEYGSIIGGGQRTTGEWIDVRNPYTQEVVGRVASVDRALTQDLIRQSRAAKVSLTRYERQQILNRMADRVSGERDSISHLITRESGLSLKDTRHEVSRAVDVLRFAAIEALIDRSESFPCDVSSLGQGRRIYTRTEPLRLVVAITPFNHPLNQVVHKIAPAIATNNKVILKPSLETPLTAHRLAEIAIECGLPSDMLNVICGPSLEVAETLVSSDQVEMVTFTGSTEVGRRIASIAGYKRLTLELGGGSSLIVLEDAPLPQAVDIAMRGVFANSGQRCTAVRRILVHQSVADNFAADLAERCSQLKYGDPCDPSTEVGAVISESAARKIECRVEASIRLGAKLLTGHHRVGAVYAPTVLDHVDVNHPVVAEETFGPVACIVRFHSLDEAIQLANNTPYGLSGAVVSNHWPSIQRVITDLETGTVNVNEAPGFRLEWSPFGGIKASGLGYKEGVIEAMKSMTFIKAYSLPWDRP